MRETTEQGEGPAGDLARHLADGVGFPADRRGRRRIRAGMLVYQKGSRLFFFNHAHDETCRCWRKAECCWPCRRLWRLLAARC